MYAVEVRAHVMIAHSFKGALFGPAQELHGATFVIDVAFFREALTADGVVVFCPANCGSASRFL